MNRIASTSLLALSVATAAACTGGERNQNGCPADEACSPLTPYGMHFTGVSLVGVPLLANPKTTAIGGTQRIELWRELATGEIVSLDLPFAAITDNGDALSIASASTNAVVLHGDATGADLLRITEADNDLLYDRYEVDAQALDHVELVPATLETYLVDSPIAFYAGDVNFGLALYSATGTRLADDSLGLTLAGLQSKDWDTFEIVGASAGTLTGTLTAAGQTGSFALDVVDALDAVLPLDDTFPAIIHPGDQGEVCFRGERSAAESVIGLPWQFSSTGQVSSVITLKPNCFALQVNAPGPFAVTGRSLGVETTIQFDAVAAAKPVRPAPAPAPAPLVDVRGDRARLVD